MELKIFDTYSNRNSFIELLRLWFMVMIVTIHAYGHGCGELDLVYSLGADWSTAHHLGLFSLGQCGVTGFMFVSGYYGITLKWNKLATIIAMLLYYVLLLAAVGGRGVGMFKLIVHPWDSWWFTSSYIIICLLSPIINKGIESLTKRQFRNIVLFLLFYEYVGLFISTSNSHDTIFLLTIFLLARYARIYPPRFLCANDNTYKSMVWLAVVSGTVLFISPILFCRVGMASLNNFFISNNNILLVVFAASLIITLDKIKFVNKYVNYMAASTLAIYLLTDNEVVRKPLDTWLLKEVLDSSKGFLYIGGISLSCLVVDKLRESLFGILQWPVRKFYVRLNGK